MIRQRKRNKTKAIRTYTLRYIKYIYNKNNCRRVLRQMCLQRACVQAQGF